MELTLSIIKPDGLSRGLETEINRRFQKSGLHVVARKELTLSLPQAQEFYSEHKDRPFFSELCTFITKGPLVVQVLKGENAILLNRQIMGATNPSEAEPGTIRRDLGLSINENTVHGSDSSDSAKREVAFFFSDSEIEK